MSRHAVSKQLPPEFWMQNAEEEHVKNTLNTIIPQSGSLKECWIQKVLIVQQSQPKRQGCGDDAAIVRADDEDIHTYKYKGSTSSNFTLSSGKLTCLFRRT